MNHSIRNVNNPAPAAFEDTLRLIASLPAPEGLEDRVKAGLRAAPRTARVLAWPAALRPGSAWMRSAAAAAIVLVVAGGGWGVYTRVQPHQAAKVLVMPPRAAQSGFSNAGAMRTPNTLVGPVVTHPAAAVPVPVKNPGAVAQKSVKRVAPRVANKAAAQQGTTSGK